MNPIHLEQNLRPGDPGAIVELVTGTGFFNTQEIAIAGELAAAGVDAPDGDYRFIVARDDTRLAGYACFGPVPGTVGSWDLYWIAVEASRQHSGIGRQLIGAVEARVLSVAGRLLWVETSARPQYTATRRFYELCGYISVATLADFYAPGDDKLILRKQLRPY